MNQDKSTTKTKICPICGTRLSESATRCLVCGSQLEAKADVKSHGLNVRRLPEMKLSLPLALGLLALIITLGVVVVLLALKTNQPETTVPVSESTATLTPTVTLTSTITPTPTLQPTFTPLPPLEYSVVSGDVCSSIAAIFGVSVKSIINENNLNANCDINPGDKLMIPQPTPTASPQPSSTLNPEQATDEACQKIDYKVLSTDTLSSIAQTYNVSMDAIRQYNAMTKDVVYEGMYLTIPLCERKPTAGPSPTPTTPPPYPAPNLLLPIDGSPFSLSNDAITVQWAAVGELRSNELYAVTIEDLTSSDGKRLVEYVNDTKFIIPVSFRPTDTVPHIMRWWVSVVRQVSTSANGTPVYEQAGMVSEKRVFSWTALTFEGIP
jgi:LysM repeat protein